MSALQAYPFFIGFRYSFSRKRNRFTSVVSLVSMLGMVLGVASLIVVLSIMNGFAGELRGRILALVPHGYIELAPGFGDEARAALAQRVSDDADVVAIAPFLREKAMLGAGRSLQGAVITGIDVAREGLVSRMPGTLVAGSLEALEEEPFGVILGAALASMLVVSVGDDVVVTLPHLTVTPLGVFPRSKRLRVVGLFQVGAQQDADQAYVSLRTAQRLLGQGGGLAGLQVKTRDLFAAPATMQRLGATLPAGARARDWSQTQGSLFRAVKMEKITVSLLLLSVVAVAAFNIVSTLVMSVTEKRGDIAVLRSMGADAGGVMAIFVAHGAVLAIFGVALGSLIGVIVASNVAAVVAWVEQMTNTRLFDPSVYFISSLPAELMWADVLAIAAASLALGLLATLYPAWRATRIAPAEVLRDV